MSFVQLQRTLMTITSKVPKTVPIRTKIGCNNPAKTDTTLHQTVNGRLSWKTNELTWAPAKAHRNLGSRRWYTRSSTRFSTVNLHRFKYTRNRSAHRIQNFSLPKVWTTKYFEAGVRRYSFLPHCPTELTRNRGNILELQRFGWATMPHRPDCHHIFPTLADNRVERIPDFVT